MKKVIFLLVVALANIVACFAQSKSETVYLKNGSVIKGQVVEMTPNKQIKVQTADGSLFVYTMEEVDRVVKDETKTQQDSSNLFSSDKGFDVKGFRGIVELGYVAGGFDAPELSFSLGYQFNPYVFLGAGAGGQYFSNVKRGGIPVFADLRGCLFLGTFSPYVSLKVGYEACIDMPVSGGFYCSPTIGGKIMTTERQALTLGIGLSVLKPDGWSSDKGFAIKLGYEF